MSFPPHPPFLVSTRKKGKDGAKGGSRVRDEALDVEERGVGGDKAGVAAVAVDGDRSSQHALKWAADHVLSRAHPFFLLHVRRKHTSLHTTVGKQFSISHVQDDVAASFLAQMDLQTKELMLPFQCFCSRRGLQCREIILDGTDVSKAIVDFVLHQNVDKVVLGASSRNAFTRTIRKLDVPTSVTKAAPNFCSVYVIAKGKLLSFRPSTHANVNDTGKEDLRSDAPGNRLLAVKSEPARKLHVEGPHSSRPMSIRAAMPIDASSDESTEEGSLMLPDQQGSANCSNLKTSSCPSEFLRNLNQPGNYLSPEYPGYHRDILLLPNKDNEGECHAPHRKYLGFDEPSFNDSTLSPGYNACEPPSEECTASTSSYQSEDVEDEVRHFKLETKQKNGDMLLWKYTEGLQLPLGTEGGIENSCEPLQELKEKKRSVEMNLPYKDRQDAEPSSAVLGPKHEILTLDTFSSDIQRRERIIEKFTDQDPEEVVNPLLRRLPPKFYPPKIDGRHGSASEETYRLELKCKSLPRPIETKRMLEGLPTRLRCRIYTPEEIANATNHFSMELKVGEGGYGPVYKATLDNTLVAVKILHSNITQGLKQFQQEVELLNNIRHPNMVHLVGACPEYGCLVYEYMPNGSLEDRLFCRSGTPPLPWQLRFKIAMEIATGLLYLHKMKPEAFVHRDLKPGNILIDKDFVSKIGDVGLARIIPRSMDDTVTQYRMTAAAGTFCYIDPEYQKTGLVSTKSDVYALGVIYLQMITAKDAMGLAYNVSDALEEGTFEELLDPNVTGWQVEAAQKFAELALKCCELRRRDRPDLESVVLPELIRLHALAVSSEDSSSRLP